MKTILLADDDDEFAQMMLRVLKAAGYATLRARNGNEALQKYDPNTVDLVITDLIMPEKEGIAVIMELRKANPDVKIIAMSGGGRNNPESYLPIARRLGAKVTLTKPFGIQELQQAIRMCLDQP